jgi:acetyl esterase/lipase
MVLSMNMSYMRRILFCLGVWILAAVGGSAVEPVVVKDVAYSAAADRLRSLDVYSPREGEGCPVVVWIHGGGWTKGDKSGLSDKPAAFVGRGYVLVSINYRMLPDVSLGEMMSDVASALRWVRDSISKHRGDPDRLFVMGHSAGAHLAALICTDGRYLTAAGVPLKALRGCIPIDVSAYDIPKRIRDLDDGISKNFRSVFGTDEVVQREFSPITYVREGAVIPPFLILHVASRSDTRAQAHGLADALKRHGFTASVVAGEGKTHGTIGSDLGRDGDAPSEAVWHFLKETSVR